MSPPNGAQVRKLRRAIIACAVIVALSVVCVFSYRSTQAWERDLDRSLQSVQQGR